MAQAACLMPAFCNTRSDFYMNKDWYSPKIKEKNTAKYCKNNRFFLYCTFLTKLQATLLKKRLWHRCFSVNIVQFLRIPIYRERLRWLLLILFQQNNFNHSSLS